MMCDDCLEVASIIILNVKSMDLNEFKASLIEKESDNLFFVFTRDHNVNQFVQSYWRHFIGLHNIRVDEDSGYQTN